MTRIAIAVAMMIGWAGTALAQTALEDSIAKRRRPDFEPIGIPVNSFLLFPKLKFGVTHTDNLFKTETNEASDQIFLMTPSFSLRSDWDRHALALTGTTTVARHRDNPDEDWVDFDLGLDGRLDITDAGRLDGAIGISRQHEDRGSPDDPGQNEPTVFHVGRLKLGAATRLDIIVLQANFTALRFDFDDAGSLDNDDRDRFQLELRGRASYEWVPGSSVFVEGALDLREFDDTIDGDGFQRSSDGWEILVGNTLDLSGVTFAELAVGYRRQSFDDAQLAAAEGISFSGRLVWNATDLLTLTGLARRLVQETTLPDASAAFTSTLRLAADYEMLENLIFDASIGYEIEQFEGIDRDDQTTSFQIGGRYLLGPNLYAGLRYSLEDRDSDAPGDSFTVNEIRAFVSAQF